MHAVAWSCPALSTSTTTSTRPSPVVSRLLNRRQTSVRFSSASGGCSIDHFHPRPFGFQPCSVPPIAFGGDVPRSLIITPRHRPSEEASISIAEVIDEAGLSAVLCYEITDRNGHDGAVAGLVENLRFIDAYRDHPRIRGTLGLHASFTVSNQTLDEAA